MEKIKGNSWSKPQKLIWRIEKSQGTILEEKFESFHFLTDRFYYTFQTKTRKIGKINLAKNLEKTVTYLETYYVHRKGKLIINPIFVSSHQLKIQSYPFIKAPRHVQTPLRQWGAGNVYLLALSS